MARDTAANIVDVGNSKAEILNGIRMATSKSFRKRVTKVVSPHGDGHAGERIVSVLKAADLGDRLITKRFVGCKVGSRPGDKLEGMFKI